MNKAFQGPSSLGGVDEERLEFLREETWGVTLSSQRYTEMLLRATPVCGITVLYLGSEQGNDHGCQDILGGCTIHAGITFGSTLGRTNQMPRREIAPNQGILDHIEQHNGLFNMPPGHSQQHNPRKRKHLTVNAMLTVNSFPCIIYAKKEMMDTKMGAHDHQR